MATLILLIFGVVFERGLASQLQNTDAPKPCATGADVQLSYRDPTIYLTYDHAGNIEASVARLMEGGPQESTRKSDKVDARNAKFLWLRLHNNTPWTIAFPTESLYVGTAITPWRLCDGVGVLGLRDGLDVNAYYRVDSAARERHPPPIVPGRIDVMPTSWLPPGRSVIFQVRREYVTERYSVYLPFNYEWETRKGVLRGGEPEHRAYFYAWMLPENVR